ncbi:MAG: hypothetical protein B0D92_05600 [Spirochaeta sp. LUC14_002_19_P3]|nr:MAG: hypothetical protein B0D92_05600 [Spirochaeta sp. LUC14_002_19_P3]
MKTFSKTPSSSEKLHRVPCPLCGGVNFIPRWEVQGAVFAVCRGCGLTVQNPRPVAEHLAYRYDDEYFRYEIENEEIFFRLMMLGLEDAAFFTDIAPTLPPLKRVLDIGCATGRLLSHFQSLGWETCGVELCAESAQYGNERFHVGIQVGNLPDLNLPAGHFSAVHASHLIEHVDDPVLFVREIASVLAEGGVFICVTPAIDGFQARFHGKKWRSAIPDHVTLFSKKTLAKLLENAGLKVETVKTWGGLAAGTAPLWLKKPADRWAKVLGWGDVVLMVARKPYTLA